MSLRSILPGLLVAITLVAVFLPVRAAGAAPSAAASSAAPPASTRPASESSPELFHSGVAALERGATDQAIDDFELLADHGFVHPDASFDRAAAYVERARSHSARPGDLGRAAAALEETLLLRPGDAEAERALTRVREQIGRRRAREGGSPITATPSMARALSALLPEDAWAFGAAFGSLLLTGGLIARRLFTRPHVVLGGAISVGVGALVLIVFGGLAAAARHFRVSSEPAVVVVEEARLLDAEGRPIAQKKGVPEHVAIPEGAKVHIVQHQAQLARVEWGTTTGWVPLDQLRVLVRP